METSVCGVIISRNEEFFLTEFLPVAKSLFDQIVIVDMNSQDGSPYLFDKLLRDDDKVVNYDPRDLFRYGFKHPRNVGAQFVQTEWIFAIDADEVIVNINRQDLLNILNCATKDVLSVTRNNIEYNGVVFDENWRDISSAREVNVENHRRIYRARKPEIRWEGFIHEELWIGNSNAWFDHDHSNVTLSHFSEFRPDRGRSTEKFQMYAWMLLHSSSSQHLKFGTNEFWYDKYMNENLEMLVENANHFAKQSGLVAFDLAQFAPEH